MGSIDIFLFYSWRPKTKKKISHSKPVKPVLMNEEWTWPSCAQTEKRKLESCTFPLVCLYSMQLCVVQHWCWSLKRQQLFQVSSYSFSHIHLFIAPSMSKVAVNHLWDLGRKWLNVVSSDTCTCIHQHYFSRVIVDLLFFLFVWRRMKPVDEDINSMATKWSTAAWTHQISAVKTAFTNSSTATAQMLRPIK